MAIRFGGRLEQWRELPLPKFCTGWLDNFETRWNIRRCKRHGEAGKVDKGQLEVNLEDTRTRKPMLSCHLCSHVICDPYQTIVRGGAFIRQRIKDLLVGWLFPPITP